MGKASDHDEKRHHDFRVFAYELDEVFRGGLSEIPLLGLGVVETRGGEDLGNAWSSLKLSIQLWDVLHRRPRDLLQKLLYAASPVFNIFLGTQSSFITWDWSLR